MLSPTFAVSQTLSSIKISLNCPFVKASSIEIHINECEFSMHAHPYFLRLTFSNELVEDGSETSSYNLDTGIIELSIPKKNNVHFEDLDMITKLMSVRPKNNHVVNQGIQVISSLNSNQEEPNKSSIDCENEDWTLRQEIPSLVSCATYGFNDLYQGYGNVISQVMYDVVDFDDLDASTPVSRNEIRVEIENAKFDGDYYMSNYVDPDPIPMSFKPSTYSILKNHQKGPDSSLPPVIEFAEEERSALAALPNKTYLASSPEKERLKYLGLIDILFAYCYDCRTTSGEHNIESAWTITKLSTTLSSLTTPPTLQLCMNSNIRRSLIYPLHRSFALAMQVLKDVVVVVKLGRRQILKCLLKTRDLLIHSECCYVMDRLYLTDYCVWIQYADEDCIRELASELNHYRLEKDDLGLGIPELEEQTKITVQEDQLKV